MNANEIVKALRILCGHDGKSCTGNCAPCPADQFRKLHPDGACDDGTMTAAAALIEQQRAELAELREAGRWIPVSERLPECEEGAETGPVLYRMKTTGTIEVGYYRRNGRWRDSYFRHLRNASDGVDSNDVTHWMPLPAAPEEQKGE